MRFVCLAFVFSLTLGAFPAMGQEAAKCKVLDPELQGKYVGGCVNGLAEGEGEATGRASYKGGFRAGRKHGAGAMTWPSGDRYAGRWEDDVPVGPLTPAMMARARAEAERAAAVSKPGVRVCREMVVGVATRDWVRGTVTAVESGRIAVRIDNPGQFQHVIADRSVRKGDVIRDAPQAWIPCL
jgi:hypothetical protein